jgi:hypothetical protein
MIHQPSSRSLTPPVARYLSNLSNGKIVLWCYLIWYINTVAHHFDSSRSIWLNSIGVSALIGIALILSVGGFKVATQDRWQTLRLFVMPFCVSSFSSLIKGQGFFLVLPPSASELMTAIALCMAFIATVIGLKRWHQPNQHPKQAATP